MKQAHRLISCLALALPPFVLGCEPAAGPRTDSQTNWLVSCQRDAECGELSCLCGVCTLSCAGDAACGDAPGSSCLKADEPGVLAACDGAPPAVTGMCLPRCDADSCSPGQQCVAGACLPLAPPGAELSVDTSVRFQSLTGFGAAIGYVEDAISALSERDALYSAMFDDLGLDVLRLRNRYGEGSEDELELARTAAIVSAAAEHLGRAPLVLLTSWSPPPTLKQNGATFCAGSPETCTLAKTPDGAFDYAGFATHWRETLDAYGRAGVLPDYIGIQNNPDWAPGPGSVAEACKFLPREGFGYPGYDRALGAVLGALASLPQSPSILAPELVGTSGADQYLASLDMSRIHAIGHHLYGASPVAADLPALTALGDLATSSALPLFQTEMQADGFDTALLMHQALTLEGASMYLQTALVGPLSGPLTNPSALIGLEGDVFVLQDPYFAMRHFARFTDPGWQRVAVSSAAPELLASAWLSPDERSLSVVLINAGARRLVVPLDIAPQFQPRQVLRSVFSGSERFAELGAPTPGSSLALPPRAMATVTFEQ